MLMWGSFGLKKRSAAMMLISKASLGLARRRRDEAGSQPLSGEIFIEPATKFGCLSSFRSAMLCQPISGLGVKLIRLVSINISSLPSTGLLQIDFRLDR